MSSSFKKSNRIVNVTSKPSTHSCVNISLMLRGPHCMSWSNFTSCLIRLWCQIFRFETIRIEAIITTSCSLPLISATPWDQRLSTYEVIWIMALFPGAKSASYQLFCTWSKHGRDKFKIQWLLAYDKLVHYHDMKLKLRESPFQGKPLDRWPILHVIFSVPLILPIKVQVSCQASMEEQIRCSIYKSDISKVWKYQFVKEEGNSHAILADNMVQRNT